MGKSRENDSSKLQEEPVSLAVVFGCDVHHSVTDILDAVHSCYSTNPYSSEHIEVDYPSQA